MHSNQSQCDCYMLVRQVVPVQVSLIRSLISRQHSGGGVVLDMHSVVKPGLLDVKVVEHNVSQPVTAHCCC